MGDEVVSVDEQTAALLARYRVAFVNVVVNGAVVPECEFNALALHALSALGVLEIVGETREGGADNYRMCPRAKHRTSHFTLLCHLVEGRVRAIQGKTGFFLSMPLPVWKRLERRLHLEEFTDDRARTLP
ncbi:hypothetical protein [Microvirga aerophila]|nr:hypothetical protein [Microvirga aerophila]